MIGQQFKMWLSLAAVAVCFIGCQDNDPKTPPVEDPRGDSYEVSAIPSLNASELEALVDGHNAFACNLFSAVAPQGQNYAVSPMSIYQALALVGNGAAGSNAAEISKVLGADNLNGALALCRHELDRFGEIERKGKDAISEYAEFEDKMTPEEWETFIGEVSGNQTQVGLANALWVSNSFAPYETFVKESKQWLNADVTALDLKYAAPTINAWFSENTNGLISPILNPSENIYAPMVAANALYLNAKWAEGFAELSENQPFTNIDGTTSWPTTLVQTRTYNYFNGADAEFISIDLGVNKEFRFEILLPKSAGTDPVTLIDARKVKELRKSVQPRYIDLQMPEFDITTTVGDLKSALSEMGMAKAFESGADFSRLCSTTGFAMANVLHRSRVHVCKSGVEAAAGTAVQSYGSPDKLPEPYELKVNRPYAWQITDSATGATLFCGVTTNL